MPNIQVKESLTVVNCFCECLIVLPEKLDFHLIIFLNAFDTRCTFKLSVSDYFSLFS